jgi:hypothetical protein
MEVNGMAQVWIMTAQIAGVAFVLSILTAVAISLIRTVLQKFVRK